MIGLFYLVGSIRVAQHYRYSVNLLLVFGRDKIELQVDAKREAKKKINEKKRLAIKETFHSTPCRKITKKIVIDLKRNSSLSFSFFFHSLFFFGYFFDFLFLFLRRREGVVKNRFTTETYWEKIEEGKERKKTAHGEIHERDWAPSRLR